MQCCSQDGVISVRNPARMRETPSWSSSRGDRRDPQTAGGTWAQQDVQGKDTFWGLYPNSCHSTGDFPTCHTLESLCLPLAGLGCVWMPVPGIWSLFSWTTTKAPFVQVPFPKLGLPGPDSSPFYRPRLISLSQLFKPRLISLFQAV